MSLRQSLKICCLAIVGVFVGISCGLSQVTLTIGGGGSQIDLMPNTAGQIVEVSIISEPTNSIVGANLVLSMLDGPALALPTLNGSIFKGGVLLPDQDANSFGINVGLIAALPGPIVDASPGQILARLSIDTTGIQNGSFLLEREGTSVVNEFAEPLAVQFAGATAIVIGDGIAVGDVNCDGSINLLDVAPFVALLSSGEFLDKADINQDGEVNLLDVGPFVDLLSQ